MNARMPALAGAVLCQLLILTARPVLAQAITMTGVVLDPMRAPIADATVIATAPPAIRVTVQTGPEGRFAMDVEPGAYTISVTAPGFRLTERHVTISASHAAVPAFVLPIEGVREEVTVSATAGYQVPAITSATRTPTPLRDIPQSVTVVTRELIRDQLLTSVADVVRYVPGVTAHQGENNRDQIVIRGNSSSADFFVNGVRDDVQYFRDLYNVDRLEALKGPNALMFGRGGAGGVVNRVIKEPRFMPAHEVVLQGGEFGHKRATLDIEHPWTRTVAFRLNAMAEDSGSFRNDVTLQRGGLNPTVTFAPNANTRVTAGYEYLRDHRVADRGITSFQGRPASVAPETFYGDPAQSRVRADVHLGSIAVERRLGRASLRNRTLIADYSRFYQNFVPGPATSDATLVRLTAYNNATGRTNVFNQTDVTFSAATGPVRHLLLAGAEIGRQVTDNFRNTGYFGDNQAATLVPFANPTTTVPLTFRQSATDANNHLRTFVAAGFVQDQMELTRYLQVLGGIRLDRFDLQYHNNRTDDTLQRSDDLVSPRAGVVVKPLEPLSLYGSYSVSYLPSSGDQFASLTTVTQQVEPEKFSNYEIGAKWDAGQGLSIATALYRLDRTNTRSTDPNDPTRIVQTGSQRTDGFEAGITGRITQQWSIAGGYAHQRAYVTSATVSARAGAVVGQVPHHTFSLWNNYQVRPRLGAGLGVTQRSDMFAAIDNTVILPGYWRADAAAFFTLTGQARLQVNVDNIASRRYYLNADSNTNISPGAPRSVRVAVVTRF